MILAELTRNNTPVSGFTPYAPFVWVGLSQYYILRDSWGTSCDDLFTYGKRVKIIQVVQDYLDKYAEADTLNDCLAQEASFFYDRENQRVFVHCDHYASPFTAALDYGYAFGLTNGDVLYIDDYEYLPIISSFPGAEINADPIGQDKPTGVSGALVLDNRTVRDETTGIPVGVLDDLVSESVYGNTVNLYDYDGVSVVQIGAFDVEDLTISEESISLNLQDKRYRE